MKPSEIYLRAAKLQAACDDVASCWVVDIAASRGGIQDAQAIYPPSHIRGFSAERHEYNVLFCPDEPPSDRRWGDDWGWDNRKSCRVLALLFMHHITKDEGRRK